MGSAVPFSPTDRDPAAGRVRAPRVPRHRRWWLALLALVLVAGGGLGNYVLVSVADDRIEVLVAARDIAWGSVITDADLSRTRIATEESEHVIPASERAAVVGGDSG